MKIIALACLVAAASATDESLAASFVQMVNTDQWCHEHHLGSGAPGCIKHNGCCFSDHVNDLFVFAKHDLGKMGPCHSCDAASDKWCEMFGEDLQGGDITNECLALSGCTYDSTTDKCISAKPEIKSTERVCVDDANDERAKIAYKACMDGIDEVHGNARAGLGLDVDGFEIWKNTVANGGCADLYYYKPACDVDSNGKFFEASQADVDSIGPDTYFCVDKYGHEIPDTRKESPLEEEHIDCEKFRQMHKGFQCPNAITLTSRGGIVMVNDMNNVDDCDVHCTTDSDCAGEDWCCYNGCGYKCQLPIRPLSGCRGAPGNEFQKVIPAGEWQNKWGCPVGKGGEDCSRVVEEDHGAQLLLVCDDGFDVIPVDTAAQDLALQCKHGHWEDKSGGRDFVDSLVCDKACSPFKMGGKSTIDGRELRERDFHVAGHEHVHGSTVEISCPEEYGVVAGTPNVRTNSREQMTCKQGTWFNADGDSHSIECSVCYDKYEFEWRDERDNSCLYYATRPMECNDNAGAVENCRVSCRSCLQAEDNFKNKDLIKDLDDVPDEKRSNWHRIKTKVQVEKKRTTYKSVNTVVTKYLPISQVCTDGAGHNIAKEEGSDECPQGYHSMA